MTAVRLITGLAVSDTGGSRPAILCLHGIGSSKAAFDGITPPLAEHFRVLAWDAPGYADSPDPKEPVGMDGYADAITALLDALGLRQVTLLGVSWGGVIATRFALRHASRLSALVLADSSRGSGISAEKASAMRARVAQLAASHPADFARARAAGLLSPSAPPDLVGRVTNAMASAIRLPGYQLAAESMASTDHSGQLRNIRVPTLVLVGQQDAICPPAESRLLAQMIPSARYAEIPGAGHLSNQEQPEAFASAVRGFLISSLDG
jgi:3-oxoadipate enol-lactonase